MSYLYSGQHRWENALRLSTAYAAPEGSALGVLFFRHSAQNSLDNRQVNYARFAQSDDRQAAGANVVLKRYYLSE
jgi:hypothetical protein